MTAGDPATGRWWTRVSTNRPAAAPWPNAAQRAAARARAEQARRPARSASESAGPVEYRRSIGPVAPPDPAGPEPAVAGPLPARPRVEDDESLLGLTRRSHSRIGQRVFTLFFVLVFLLIAAQMVMALLGG